MFEDFGFQHGKGDGWILQGLEPEDQGVIGRIDETVFFVFRKSEDPLRYKNEFVVADGELSKTSCFYDHAQPLDSILCYQIQIRLQLKKSDSSNPSGPWKPGP